MADLIRVQVEFKFIFPKGSDVGKTVSSGDKPEKPTKGKEAKPSGLSEEFRTLSAQVRSVAAGLAQLKEALASVASGVTGGGVGVSGAAPSPAAGGRSADADALRAATADVESAMRDQAKEGVNNARAARASAEATREETAASSEGTKAKKDEAAAAREVADAHERSEKAQNKAKKATEASAKATDEFARAALRQRGFESIGTRRFGERRELPLGGVGKEVVQPFAADPELRRRAASLQTAPKELTQLKRGTSPELEGARKVLEQSLADRVARAAESIRKGDPEAEVIKRLRSGAAENIRTFEARAGGPVLAKKPGEISGELASRAAAQSTVAQADRVNRAAEALGKGLEDGVDSLKIGELETALSNVTAAFVTFIQKSGILQATVGQVKGQEVVTKGPELRARVLDELNVAPAAIETNKIQENAINALRRAVKSGSTSILQSSRDVFKALAADGKGLKNFENNLLGLNEVLGSGTRKIADTRMETLRLNKVIDILRNTQQRAGGSLRAPPGAVDAEVSSIFAGEALTRARGALFAPGRRLGAKEQVTFDTTDARGNVKKITAVLTRLGDKFSQVKIKAQDASDNMFDRTSVKTALQRVATWGAAAGIVFGAVNAFKTAVRTLVDTESAIIGLAKVMDESSLNFDKFRERAKEAAIGIAQEFGQPLKDVLETLTLFGQQGKTLEESTVLASASALAANVTTLDQPTAASALTAATEQFGLAISDAEAIVDKFNEVANNAAVTETVLAEAFKKAGLAAKNSGVSVDEFNGIIAAISEQTRQSGNEIGTALRFIFSRITTDEAQSGLAAVGISARDTSGELRGFIPIIEELSKKFETLSDSQKKQVAISIAGTRRFNTLLALLNNFSRFQEATTNSINSAGSALREQEKVVTTAAFKIQQLKNSLVELAITVGDTVLGPIKSVTDAVSTMVNAISGLNPAIVATIAGLGLGGAAFSRFGERLIGTIGLGGAFKNLGVSISQSLTKGLGEADVKQALGARFEDVRTFQPELLVARGAGDFAGLSTLFRKASSDSNSFAETLRKSNRVLLDQRGAVVKNAASFTKFGATVRGFRTRELEATGAALSGVGLSLAGLNSGIGRFIGFLVLIPNKLLGLIGLSRVFGRIDAAAASMNSTVATAATGLLRLAAAGAVIFGVIKVISALRDAVTRTGADTVKSLEPEIAKRQEALKLIKDQVNATKTLATARDSLARTAGVELGESGQLSPLVRDQIARKQFRSPLLEKQRLRESERTAAASVGLANPQLIASVDEFGNVILRSASALEEFAASASSAEADLLALSRVKAFKALSEDLQEASGAKKLIGDLVRTFKGVAFVFDFFGGDSENLGKTEGDRFNKARKAFLETIRNPQVKLAQELGVDLGVLNAKLNTQLKARSDDLKIAGLEITQVIKALQDQLDKLPSDTAGIALKSLLVKGSPSRAFFQREAESRSAITGKDVRIEDIVNQTFLQTTSAIRSAGARNAIGVSVDETIARFRESGVVAKVVNLQGDIAKEIQKFEGGELVLFPNIVGVTEQAIVEVTASGRRQIRGFGEGLVEETRDFGEALRVAARQNLDVFTIDPKRLAEEVNSAFIEVQRVVTGAARGNLLQKDFDLGAKFNFDLTAQQRVAFSDEELFGSVFKAEKKLKTFLESFGSSAVKAGENVEGAIDPSVVAEFGKLADELDKLKVVIRIKSEIEEVARAFEKAANSIRDSGIKEEVQQELSGLLGGGATAISREAQTAKLSFELSGEELFAELNPGFIRLSNTLARGDKATVDFITGLRVATKNNEIIFRDFQAASAAGGITDRTRISEIQEAASALVSGDKVDAARALTLAIAQKSLDAQSETNVLLQRLLDKDDFEDPKVFGSALRQAAELLPDSGSAGDRARLQGRVAGVSTADLREFTKQDLDVLFQTFGDSAGARLGEVVRERRATAATSELNSALLRLADPGSGGGASFNEALRSQARALSNLAGPSQPPNEQTRVLLEIARDFTAARGGQVDISPETLDAFAEQTFKFLRSQLEPTRERLQGFVGQVEPTVDVSTLEAGFRAGDPAIVNIIETALRSAVASPDTPTKRPTPLPDGVDPEETIKATAERAKAIEETIKLSRRQNKSIIDSVKAFDILGVKVSNLSKDITDSATAAFDKINIDRQLQQFTSPVFGALQGIDVPSIDLGKRREELSGRELAALGSPDLARSLTEANTVFVTLTGTLRKVKEAEVDLLKAREAFQAKGNIEGITQTDQRLQQLGSVAALVQGQISGARDNLKRFGETFRGLSEVNQLTADVEKLFDSFRKQRRLLFDRTSLDTAAGKGPFAIQRPTFEQFSQGQAGDLTRFERAIESISFRQRRGEVTPQEATRGRREAEFERDESIISLVQERETQKLQLQVNAAEQVRKRLLDFVADVGGPGSEVAQSLLDTLTSELERAGDILPSSFGPRRIRDPRTGQQVNVPASQVLQFRGVQGLEGIISQVQQLSQQASTQQAQEEADLIVNPLVRKLDEIVEALRTPFDGAPAQDRVATLTTFERSAGTLDRLLNDLTTGSVDRGTAKDFRAFNTTLAGLSRENRQVVLNQDVFSRDGDAVKVGSIVQAFTESADADIAALATSILSDLGEGAAKFAELPVPTSEFDALKVVSTGLGRAFVGIVDSLARLGGAIESIVKGVGGPLQGPGFAQGGLIVGPGGPTSDQVPIRASAGEFVVNARAVRSIGADRLNQLNKSTGSIGADGSITGTPTIKLQEGGSIAEEIAKLKRRQRALAGKVVGGNQLTAGEQEEKLRIDRDLQQLEARRSKIVQDRRTRLEELDRFGVRQDESGRVVVPEGSQLDTPALAAFVAEEQERRVAIAKQAGEPGRFSRFNQAESARRVRGSGFFDTEESDREGRAAEVRSRSSVFVRKTKSGRLSFSNSPDRGGVSLERLGGLDAQNADALFREVEEREVFDTAVQNTRATRRKKVEAEFIELSDAENKQLAKEGQLRNFEAALGELQTRLDVNSAEFFQGFPSDVNDALSQLKLAQDPDFQRDASGDRFQKLAVDLNGLRRKLSSRLITLEGTRTVPHQVSFPPDFGDPEFLGRFLLRDPESSLVNVGFDSLTGQYSPEIFGFAASVNAAQSSFVGQVPKNLEELLRENAARAGSQVSATAAVGRFGQRFSAGAGLAAQATAESVAESTGNEFLGDAVAFPIKAVGVGGSVLTQTVGGIGAGFVDLVDTKLDPQEARENLFFAVTGAEAGDAVAQIPSSIVSSNENIKDLEIILGVEKDPIEREKLKNQLAITRQQRNQEATLAVAAIAGTAVGGLRTFRRARNIPAKVRARRATRDIFDVDLDSAINSRRGKISSPETSAGARKAMFDQVRVLERRREIFGAKQRKIAAKAKKRKAKADKRADKANKREAAVNERDRIRRAKQEASAAKAIAAQQRRQAAAAAPETAGPGGGEAGGRTGVGGDVEGTLRLADPGVDIGSLAAVSAVEEAAALSRPGISGAQPQPFLSSGLTKRKRFRRGLVGGLLGSAGGLPGGLAGAAIGAFPEIVTSTRAGAALIRGVTSPFKAIGSLFSRKKGPSGVVGDGTAAALSPAANLAAERAARLRGLSPKQRAAFRDRGRAVERAEILRRNEVARRQAFAATGVASVEPARVLSGTAERLGRPSRATQALFDFPEVFEGVDIPGRPRRPGRGLGEATRRAREIRSGASLAGEVSSRLGPDALGKLAADGFNIKRIAENFTTRDVGGKRFILDEIAREVRRLDLGNEATIAARSRFIQAPITPVAKGVAGSILPSSKRITKQLDIPSIPRSDLPPVGADIFDLPAGVVETQAEIAARLERQFRTTVRRKFAFGGKVTGPGGPKSDQVPILASNGEFVLNAASVSKLGLPAVEAMNQTGRIPKFANGGRVKPFSGAGVFSLGDKEEKSPISITDSIASLEAQLSQLKRQQKNVGSTSEGSAGGFDFDPATGLFTKVARSGNFGFDPDKGIFFPIDTKKEEEEKERLFAEIRTNRESQEFGFALGGAIRGPGGSLGDRIPILASNGEFVINAKSASKLGTNALNLLNSGTPLSGLPKFQGGGLVGGDGGSSGSVEVTVDTDAISNAISNAIIEAIQTETISLDAEAAAVTISAAIEQAVTNIQLPEVNVNADSVTVAVDIPAAGIPLDVSALNNLDLGGALGADVRNRLEAVEGTVQSNREDVNTLLDSAEGEGQAPVLEGEVAALTQSVVELETQLLAQNAEILSSVEGRLNERFNEDNTEINVNARIDRELTGINENLLRLEGQVATAMSTANRAVTLGSARL